MEIGKVIIVLSYLPVLVVGLYSLKVLTYGRELRAFCWFAIFSALINGISQAAWFYEWNNLPLLHIYVPVGFALLAWFYQSVWAGLAPRWLLPSLAIGVIFYSLCNTLFVQGLFTFNSYALTLQSAVLVMLSLSTYSLLLDDRVKERKRHYVASLNWINSGLFVYHSSNLVMFYFGDVIMDHSFPSEVGRYAWLPHSLFSAVMYVCFFIGLWKVPKP